MNELKGLALLALAALFLLFVALQWKRDLVDPYTWDNDYRAQAQQQGYQLAIENKSGDLALPWTWFKPIISGMAFVKPDTIRITPDGATLAPLIWIHRDNQTGRVDQYSLNTLLDCRTGKFRDADTPSPQWTEMSAEMNRYFCRR